jgi:hypothetical protein
MDIDAIVERILGEKTRLKRRKRRVLFHVLAVNLTIKHIDAETSFYRPVTSEHLDWYFGMHAWNDWIFHDSRTRTELDPKNLLHHKGDGCEKKDAGCLVAI